MARRWRFPLPNRLNTSSLLYWWMLWNVKKSSTAFSFSSTTTTSWWCLCVMARALGCPLGKEKMVSNNDNNTIQKWYLFRNPVIYFWSLNEREAGEGLVEFSSTMHPVHSFSVQRILLHQHHVEVACRRTGSVSSSLCQSEPHSRQNSLYVFPLVESTHFFCLCTLFYILSLSREGSKVGKEILRVRDSLFSGSILYV